MEEIWLPVQGYEGLYEVSDHGRVRSGKVILKPHHMNNGYDNVSLFKNGKYKFFGIHRLVALAFVPNESRLPQVNHKDGNKRNNFASNLEWCSASRNIQHAYDEGLKENCRKHCRELGKRGSRELDAYRQSIKRPVISIRIDSGVVCHHESVNQAARDTGCDLAAVSKILRGKQHQTKGYRFEYDEKRSDENGK